MSRKRDNQLPAATPRAAGAVAAFPLGTGAQGRPAQEARVLPPCDGYALWASSYDLDSNPILALEERILTPLLPPLAGKAALDIACGTGRWLLKLVHAGARPAIGIDLSSAMLRAAGTKPLLRNHLARADGRSLPVGSRFAEIILISFAARHIADLSAFAREAGRVAKPGACCYLIDLHPAACARGWRVGFRHDGRPIEIFTFRHSGEDICRAFANQGFDLLQTFEPCLGEAERPVFERAGRPERFAEVSGIPAVLICHFQRQQRGDDVS